LHCTRGNEGPSRSPLRASRVAVVQARAYDVPTLRGNMMQAVNIRQLKNNPSTALRAAREDDMVVVMNRDHPEALLVSLDTLQLPEPAAVRVALAVSLFRSGAVSAGFAARMADKPLGQMLTLLASLGIPLSGNTETEGREDMASARQWLNEGS